MAKGKKGVAGPMPPPPMTGKSKKKTFGGYPVQNIGEFAEHADEVIDIAAGRDIVDAEARDREKRPSAFDRKGLQKIRSWTRGRPLEPNSPAATMVPYPRTWTTKRGRYSRFRLPGAGIYGLLRARPTF